MSVFHSDPIRDQQRSERIAGAAERFWGAFRFTENGHVKSTLLLYSFCLCALFILIYAVAYCFLLDPIHALMANASGAARLLAEAVVPAIAGTAVCGLAWPVMNDKRLMPASFTWMLLLALACLAAMLILIGDDPETRNLFLLFFAQSVPAPILLGGGLSAFLYGRRLKRPPAAGTAGSRKGQ